MLTEEKIENLNTADLVVATTTEGITSVFYKYKSEVKEISKRRVNGVKYDVIINDTTLTFIDLFYGLTAVYEEIYHHPIRHISRWKEGEKINCELDSNSVISFNEARSMMIEEQNPPLPEDATITNMNEINAVKDYIAGKARKREQN